MENTLQRSLLEQSVAHFAAALKPLISMVLVSSGVASNATSFLITPYTALCGSLRPKNKANLSEYQYRVMGIHF